MSVSIWLTVGGDVHVILADYIKSGGIRQQLGWYTFWIILTLNTFVPLFVCVCKQILYNHRLHVSVGDYRANWEHITMYHIHPNVQGGCSFQIMRRFLYTSLCCSALSNCWLQYDKYKHTVFLTLPSLFPSMMRLVNKTQLILFQLLPLSYILIDTK